MTKDPKTMAKIAYRLVNVRRMLPLDIIEGKTDHVSPRARMELPVYQL